MFRMTMFMEIDKNASNALISNNLAY